MKLSDKLYWSTRHTAIFLMNLLAYVPFLVYHLLRALIEDFIGCFTADGSTQILPFWDWNWSDKE